jgi:hypothetical protein
MVKRFFGTAVAAISLLAVLTGGIGCDLFEDIDCEGGNYINVEVCASIHAEVHATEPHWAEAPWTGAQLQVEIIKAGGERVTCTGTTNIYGNLPETCQGTFKVYRAQFVEVVIRPISGVYPDEVGGEIYDPARHMWSENSSTLNWHDLEDYGWGDTYYWSPNTKLIMQKDW